MHLVVRYWALGASLVIFGECLLIVSFSSLLSLLNTGQPAVLWSEDLPLCERHLLVMYLVCRSIVFLCAYMHVCVHMRVHIDGACIHLHQLYDLECSVFEIRLLPPIFLLVSESHIPSVIQVRSS